MDLEPWIQGREVPDFPNAGRLNLVKMSQADPTAFSAALTRHPQVEDAAVLRRPTVDGADEMVAYLMTGRGADADRIAAETVRDLALDRGELVAVPVSSLPLDDDGAVDVRALGTVPVVDAV